MLKILYSLSFKLFGPLLNLSNNSLVIKWQNLLGVRLVRIRDNENDAMPNILQHLTKRRVLPMTSSKVIQSYGATWRMNIRSTSQSTPSRVVLYIQMIVARMIRYMSVTDSWSYLTCRSDGNRCSRFRIRIHAGKTRIIESGVKIFYFLFFALKLVIV